MTNDLISTQLAANAFEAALRAPLGVLISTNSARKAKACLYAYRKACQAPELFTIEIRFGLDDPEHTLYLIKGQETRKGRAAPRLSITADLSEL